MDKILDMFAALISAIKSVHFLFFLGALICFIAGYASSYFMEHDNAIEEISEMLLKKFYHVDVEFTPDNQTK